MTVKRGGADREALYQLLTDGVGELGLEIGRAHV